MKEALQNKALEKAKRICALREYGIITYNEYAEEINKIRVLLGLDELPAITDQTAAHRNAKLKSWWARK